MIKKIRFSSICKNIILTTMGMLFLLPIVWMFSASLQPMREVFENIIPFSWKSIFPSIFTMENFIILFRKTMFARHLMNTFFVAFIATGLNLIVNSMAAYGFARMEFPGKNIIFIVLLTTLVLPMQIVVIPLYLIVRSLGLVDTYTALILPWVSRAFSIFLLRQFFLGIPKELEEAARIDGCSEWGIYWRIILPLSKPVLITLGLLQFQAVWDDFLWPLVVINREELRVIQVSIASFQYEGSTLWEFIFPACAISGGVTLGLYIIFQRYYSRGIYLTGLKG